MGLGKLLNRDLQYVATNTVTGAVDTYTIAGGLAPDWPTAAGSYRGGMTVPGAWRAATLLSDLIGQLPWCAYRDYGDTPTTKIEPTPPLLDQPAPPETRMVTLSSMALDLLWEGNAVGLVASRNVQGWPTSIYPVPAYLVGVRRVTATDHSTLPIGAIEYQIGSMRLGSDDVVHVKGPCEPGALRGLGVLEAHLLTLSLATEQGRQARSVSRHGVPTGILSSDNPDLTPTEAAELKAGWLASQRDRTVAVVNATTHFTPLSWTPEQLEMTEARKFTLTELELIFGMPVGWLGGQSSSRTYSNIEQDAVNLIKFSVAAHIARFEQEFSRHFPRGTAVRATLDGVLRADTATRYAAHAVGIDAGFLTVNEARELEHLPPLPDAEPDPDPAEPPADPPADPTTETEAPS